MHRPDDFLRGTEPYKLDWACDRRETCSIRIEAPSLRAKAAAAAGKAYGAARDVARAVAPERAWDALRRARRSFDARGRGGAGDRSLHAIARGRGEG